MDTEEMKFVNNIYSNLQILKKVLDKDIALANMLSDMINNIKK